MSDRTAHSRRREALVVGGGLAGCVVAWQLHLRGVDVAIVDHPGRSRASRIAGGLINPITGVRLVTDPAFALQRAEALAFYQHLERHLNVALFHPLPQWRLFRDERQRRRWIKRKDDPEVLPWHEGVRESHDFPSWVSAPFGGIQVPDSGWLDIGELIEQTRTHLPWREQDVDDNTIRLTGSGVEVGDVTGERAILCRGFAESYRHFDPPVLQHAKGEILLLRIEGIPTTHSIHRGGWLLPVKEGLWKAGATYTWDPLDQTPTTDGRTTLLRRIHEMVHAEVEVVDHVAGVRPIAKPRGPILLHHPQAPLSILNGLGSKGALLAPAMSRALLADNVV